MANSNERLYAIKPDEGYFCAGVIEHGTQVLMGLICPNLVIFRFDREGHLIGSEQHMIHFFKDSLPPFDIYDDRIQPMIEMYKQEIRFRPATIRVRKFWSPEHRVGIEDYPSHFHEILADSTTDVSERTDVRESMKLWDEDGQFVLHWGNDFWLDQDGSVVSS